MSGIFCWIGQVFLQTSPGWCCISAGPTSSSSQSGRGLYVCFLHSFSGDICNDLNNPTARRYFKSPENWCTNHQSGELFHYLQTLIEFFSTKKSHFSIYQICIPSDRRISEPINRRGMSFIGAWLPPQHSWEKGRNRGIDSCQVWNHLSYAQKQPKKNTQTLALFCFPRLDRCGIERFTPKKICMNICS